MSHTKGKLKTEAASDHPDTDPRWLLTGEVYKPRSGKSETMILATTCGGNDEANAKRIVLCWNTHDDLLEACKGLLSICERFGQHDIDCATQAAAVGDEIAAMGCTCGVSKGRAAIAKAEKGS
jgi:hypothetical protein